MSDPRWMIYGANGYTGRLIAQDCQQRGLAPILGGRSEKPLAELAGSLGLPYRCFALDDDAQVRRELEDLVLILHCAGPFSATSKPMLQGCLAARTHYLDITGEIDVFEHAHGLGEAAADAGIVVCPGVGFDVVPTDCLAATLKNALTDADALALGFDARASLSPGTAKTSFEGLARGGRIRKDGRIVAVPLAYRERSIDFGNGEKRAMTIPWGDVSTAYYTTGIPNIETYIPASPKLISRLRLLNLLRPLLRLSPVQRLGKARIEARLSGPTEAERARDRTYVWGEARNPQGQVKTARMVTGNGYSVTVAAAVQIVLALLEGPRPGGSYTPSQLMGADFACTLPGSSEIRIE